MHVSSASSSPEPRGQVLDTEARPRLSSRLAAVGTAGLRSVVMHRESRTSPRDARPEVLGRHQALVVASPPALADSREVHRWVDAPVAHLTLMRIITTTQKRRAKTNAIKPRVKPFTSSHPSRRRQPASRRPRRPRSRHMRGSSRVPPPDRHRLFPHPALDPLGTFQGAGRDGAATNPEGVNGRLAADAGH